MSLSEVWVALWEKRMKHPQHSSEFSAYWALEVFSLGGLLGTICSQMPRLYCIF
jgi:hypothetical protein